MRLGIRKDIDWEYLGAVLAQSDSCDQAVFFKSFVKECLSWGTRLQVETQLSCVNKELTNEERGVLGMIGYSD